MPAARPVDGEERTPKKGDVTRITTERTVDAHCADCPLAFPSTGAAWSHAAGSRHTVDVRYAVAFAFVPNTDRGA
jgi:hypothetical protein